MSDPAADTESDPKPRLTRDVAAIGLLAATAFLTAAMVTFDPSDPVAIGGDWISQTPMRSTGGPADYHVGADSTRYTNACGRLGAAAAGQLYGMFGLAAAIVVAAMGGAATAFLTRGGMNAPVLRSLGATILLPAAAGVVTMSAAIPGMPVVGSGGVVGGMVTLFLTDHFAPAGAWILLIAVTASSLLLISDYALLYAGRRVLSSGKMVSVATLRRSGVAMPLKRRRQPFTDLDEPIRLTDEDDTSSASSDPESVVVDDPDIRVRTPAEKRGNDRRGLPEDAHADDDDDLDAVAMAAAGTGILGAAAAALGLTSGDEVDDQPETIDVEVDDEIRTLREDGPHDDVPEPSVEPRVKAPKRKRKSEGDDDLLDNLIETAPGGGDTYRLPSIELLTPSDDVCYDDQLDEVRRKAKVLEETFRNFGFNIRVVEIETGPVIAQYEIELEAGLRLSKITSLADDVAISLRVPSVRIVAPIPGKNTVGIEVPNETRQVVRIRDVIEDSDGSTGKMNIPVFLGQDVSGNPLVVDLAKMPHLLIAGRTGTGKSVCLNSIICSVLMSCRPDEVRMLMIDPKMVELSGYGRLPHLMHPVITDMKKAEAILAWAVDKMEERYSLLAKVGVRHINSFNDLGRDEVARRLEIDDRDATEVPDRLPFIVIVADEMADLMMTAGKDVEQHIIRLAQKSRAVGIHLILATQKPTVDVITGLIKSNLPARLSFQVASKTDSRVVLDENGADKLLGNGDMLFLWPGTSTLIRGQGTFLSDEEIDAITDHCSSTEQDFAAELMNLQVAEEDGDGPSMEKIKQRDELYDSAIEVVIREGRGSCSLLQRCLGIGYGRAAKLIDYMAEDGIVGDYNGSKAREVILTMAQWQTMQGLDVDTDDEAAELDEPESQPESEAEAVTASAAEDEEYEDWE